MDELIEWCEQERRHGPRVRDYGEADKKYKAIIQALRELQSCREENERLREDKQQRKDAAEKWTMDDKYDY